MKHEAAAYSFGVLIIRTEKHLVGTVIYIYFFFLSHSSSQIAKYKAGLLCLIFGSLQEEGISEELSDLSPPSLIPPILFLFLHLT